MQEAHRFNAAATNRTGECRNTGCASFVSTSYVPAFFEIAQALIPDFLPGRRFRLYSRLSCADCCDNAACHYYSSYYDSIARYELQNMYHYEAGLLLVHWRSPQCCSSRGMRVSRNADACAPGVPPAFCVRRIGLLRIPCQCVSSLFLPCIASSGNSDGRKKYNALK